jgi:hypothetical protein
MPLLALQASQNAKEPVKETDTTKEAQQHGDDDKIDMSIFVISSTDGAYGYSPEELHPKICYFPKDSVSASEQYTFSNNLAVMREPVLTAEGKGKDYYALRILYVPSLVGFPIAVRIEKNGDQIIRRSVKLANRASSGTHEQVSKRKTSGNRKILEQKNETISTMALVNIQNELNNAGFDALPLHDDVRGLDGSEFLIERIENGKHTVFTRWTPEAGTARRKLIKIFALADRLFQEAGFWEKKDSEANRTKNEAAQTNQNTKEPSKEANTTKSGVGVSN